MAIDEKSDAALEVTDRAEYMHLLKNAPITELAAYIGKDIDAAVADSDVRTKIIERVVRSGRARALEHVNFNFRINGVSLSTLTHFTRHRMQSIDIPLFTNIKRDSFVLPETISGDAELRGRYEAMMRRAADFGAEMLNAGVSAEDAVYSLLSGNVLDFVMTMNARELLLFFRLRTCERAQWEIRDYADEMLRLCREVSPGIFRYFGPGCYVSGCPEGKMSCGKAAEVREKFRLISRI